MTSLTLTADMILGGLAKGTPANADQRSSISRRVPYRPTSSAASAAVKVNNVIDRASIAQSLAPAGTVAIDLTTFTVNPFSEAAQVFSTVRVIYIEHVTGSLSSGISVFNAGAGNSFQGPVSAAGTITLAPGEDQMFRSRTVTGWVVDATHKNFYIVNNDAINAATIRYLIAGVSP